MFRNSKPTSFKNDDLNNCQTNVIKDLEQNLEFVSSKISTDML